MPRLFAFFAALFFFLPNLSFAGEKPSVTAGAILPLTGILAPVGADLRRGMELAAGEVKNISLKLVFEDDRSADKKEALNAAKKLLSVDRADVVFNAYASSVSAIAPVFAQAEAPLIIVWDSNHELPGFGKYVIGFGYSNEQSAEDMAEFAFRTLQKKSVAVVAFQDEWSELMARSFSEAFRRQGGQVVVEDSLNPSATEFRSLLAKARVRGAESIYAPLWGAGLTSLLKQGREQNFMGPILTGDSFSDEDVKRTGQAAEGLYATQVWFDDESFKRKYLEKFGESAMTGVNLGFVALAFDAIMAIDSLALALKIKGLAPTRQHIADALPGFAFEGVLGKTSINEQRLATRREPILTVREGRYRPVATPAQSLK